MGDYESDGGQLYGGRVGMQGRIIKGIGGFYYVHTDEGIYTCKAKGLFRLDKTKPLVGDYVDIDVIPDEEMTGNITKIHERTNELIRPNVANVDQTLIIFALVDPVPNFVTLDKMILQYKAQGIPVLICFNKDDLANEDLINETLHNYSMCGCKLFVTSARDNEGIDRLLDALSDKTSVVAGPSGVGKSSIINCLTGEDKMATGEISKKLSRGRHTTRHSEIIPVRDNTYIIDTPGFGSFDLFDIRPEDLSDQYEEFANCQACRFMPCSHTHEPDCKVKESAAAGHIPALRYDNYVHIFNELTKIRRYR